MQDFESAELQKVPAFVKLFRDAFPAEAAQADAANNMDLLINDNTVLRSRATFMRTLVTRNTPFDKFLAAITTPSLPASGVEPSSSSRPRRMAAQVASPATPAPCSTSSRTTLT